MGERGSISYPAQMGGSHPSKYRRILNELGKPVEDWLLCEFYMCCGCKEKGLCKEKRLP